MSLFQTLSLDELAQFQSHSTANFLPLLNFHTPNQEKKTIQKNLPHSQILEHRKSVMDEKYQHSSERGKCLFFRQHDEKE